MAFAPQLIPAGEHLARPVGLRLLGILFVLLALSAGMISLVINISFGLETSMIAAAVFGLSDGAKIVLPMAAATLGGWNMRRRMAWLVAVIISVAAALSSLLEDEAGRIQASRMAADATSAAHAVEANARQELAGIREPLPAAVLQRLADEAGAEAVPGGFRNCPQHVVEVDGYHMVGDVRPGNEKKDRLDRRLAGNRASSRRVLVALCERGGRSWAMTFETETAA